MLSSVNEVPTPVAQTPAEQEALAFENTAAGATQSTPDVGVSDGWTVETEGISLRPSKRASSASFGKRVLKMTKSSSYTWSQVEKLLGELPEKPMHVAASQSTGMISG